MIYRSTCSSGTKCIPLGELNNEEELTIVKGVLNDFIRRTQMKTVSSSITYHQTTLQDVIINKLTPSQSSVEDEIKNVLINIHKILTQFDEIWREKYMAEYEDIVSKVRDIVNGKNGDVDIFVDNSNAMTYTLHIYGNYINVNLTYFKNSDQITSQIYLKDLDNWHINVEEIVNEEKLKITKYAARVTDETVTSYGAPLMTTTRLWQFILSLIMYPGDIRVNLNTININKEEPLLVWKIAANGYLSDKDSENMNKAIQEIINDPNSLVQFTSQAAFYDGTIVIGNGSDDVERVYKSYIEIVFGEAKRDLWDSIVKALREIGIYAKVYPRENKYVLRIRRGDGVRLAKLTLDVMPDELKKIFNILEPFDFIHWIRLKELASFNVRLKGAMLIDIGGYYFSPNIKKDNYNVELRITRKDKDMLMKIAKELKEIFGINVTITEDRGYPQIVILYKDIIKNEKVKEAVIRGFNELLKYSNLDEKVKKKIEEAIRRLRNNSLKKGLKTVNIGGIDFTIKINKLTGAIGLKVTRKDPSEINIIADFVKRKFNIEPTIGVEKDRGKIYHVLYISFTEINKNPVLRRVIYDVSRLSRLCKLIV